MALAYSSGFKIHSPYYVIDPGSFRFFDAVSPAFHRAGAGLGRLRIINKNLFVDWTDDAVTTDGPVGCPGLTVTRGAQHALNFPAGCSTEPAEVCGITVEGHLTEPNCGTASLNAISGDWLH
ncbi:hypothetical protein BaRGS_00003113 [Batillaria attramentaria]|uniref:Uncharacterized protein n=1 Tax=Batillaria attramentaria TaxID=370345 RepID=A0ABD0M3R2_9CAEN